MTTTALRYRLKMDMGYIQRDVYNRLRGLGHKAVHGVCSRYVFFDGTACECFNKQPIEAVRETVVCASADNAIGTPWEVSAFSIIHPAHVGWASGVADNGIAETTIFYITTGLRVRVDAVGLIGGEDDGENEGNEENDKTGNGGGAMRMVLELVFDHRMDQSENAVWSLMRTIGYDTAAARDDICEAVRALREAAKTRL